MKKAFIILFLLVFIVTGNVYGGQIDKIVKVILVF